MRRRAFQLFKKINVDYSVWPLRLGEKPRWMRWKTYWMTYETAVRLHSAALHHQASSWSP
jgi:hypothetical protein